MSYVYVSRNTKTKEILTVDTKKYCAKEFLNELAEEQAADMEVQVWYASHRGNEFVRVTPALDFRKESK